MGEDFAEVPYSVAKSPILATPRVSRGYTPAQLTAQQLQAVSDYAHANPDWDARELPTELLLDLQQLHPNNKPYTEKTFLSLIKKALVSEKNSLRTLA